MRRTLFKLGSYFRRQIGVDLIGAHPCALCGEPTQAERRSWSPHLSSYIDAVCIPAIVRRRGPQAVGHWLRTGELLEGTRSEQAFVNMQTETGGFRR